MFFMQKVCSFCIILSFTDAFKVFLTEPSKEPYFIQADNKELILPCVINSSFFDVSKYELSWAKYYKSQLQVLTKNDKTLVRKKGGFVLEYDSYTGSYNLKLNTTEKTNTEGTYYCNVIATETSDAQYSAFATVIFLATPSDPILSITPGSLNEGDIITSKCISLGGSPHPVFYWWFPNGTKADKFKYTTLFTGEATESFMHFRVVASDNGNNVQCAVTNKAMPENTMKTVKSSKLNVFFKPIVSVTPAENFTHLSVEEGSIVNLSCDALSNPPSHSFEWKHLHSGERYQGKIWPIVVNSSFNGDFECLSANKVGQGYAKVEVIVQYAPKLFLPTSVDPDESKNISIDCKIDAFPNITNVHWIGPNNFKINGSHLSIPYISKKHTGNYSCVATNFLTVYGQSGSQQRTKTRTVYINVKRKPGITKIKSLRRLFDVGESIQLECYTESDGNPTAMYKWSRDTLHSEEVFGKNLIIKNAQLTDNGIYWCKAFNNLGEGSPAFFNVSVVEKAIITSPLTTERIFTSDEYNKTLECEAEGYPVPMIIWLKNGVKIEKHVTSIVKKSNCNKEDFCTQKITSTLTFPEPLKWFHKGNFTCIADNGSSKFNKLRSSWTIVRILHKPVIIKTIFHGKSLSAANIGAMAIITCTVSARPEPTFYWMHKGSEILEDNRHSFHVSSSSIEPDQYTKSIHIENVKGEDYGEYVCRATNGNGIVNNSIELHPSTQPYSPVKFQKISATPNSILLSWVPQFDGGYDQVFVLEIKKENTKASEQSNTTLSILELTNIEYRKEYKDDGVVILTAVYNVTGLRPLSTYDIRIKAKNNIGSSEYAPALTVSTEDVIENRIIMRPNRLSIDPSSYKLRIEPKIPTDACLLLYVFVSKTWKTIDCYLENPFSSEILFSLTYKARFCTVANVQNCSPLSEPMIIGSNMKWTKRDLIPVVFFSIIGVIICLIFVVCCKTQKTMETSKLEPIVLLTSTYKESKKTIEFDQPITATFENSFETEKKTNNSSNFSTVSDKTPLQHKFASGLHLQANTVKMKDELMLNNMEDKREIKTVINNQIENDDRIVREIIV